MRIEEVQNKIFEAARTLSLSVPSLSWYLFGSSLENFDRAKDIDILIIYQGNDSTIIREHLKEFTMTMPVHLTLLTEEEELELKFVQFQACRKIHP